MPAITVPKQFGQGLADLFHGNKTGPSTRPHLRQVLNALNSDIIDIRGVVSELIAANGGATTAITLSSKLVTFS